MTIWKYMLPFAGRAVLTMPKGARPLSVAEQRGNVTLWALVDERAENEQRFFEVVMTGARYQSYETHSTSFVGTVLLESGSFVAHVFEVLT